MTSGIDHIVIAVADPDASASELTEALGLEFTAGGSHPGLGTFNRIAFLGDSYLELIGIEDASLAAGWAVGMASMRALEQGSGFATYALADDAIRISVARLQANGSRIGPVVHRSRERPDGEQVEWWSATPPELGPDQPPFLIKHLAAGAEWGAEAVVARRAFSHPIGSPAAIEQLQVATPDPQGLAAACYRDLDLQFWLVGDVAVCSIGRQAIRLIGGEAAATIVIGAEVDAPRRVTACGIRFEVVPATLPAAVVTS